MKTVKSVLIILICIPIVVVVFQATKLAIPVSEKPIYTTQVESVEVSNVVNAEQLCYIWNTEAGDKAQLSMDIRGEKVIGEFNWLPAEKDKKTGIFKGTVTSLNSDPNKRSVNAVWDVHAEGVVNQEQLGFTFNDSIATLGFGEMKLGDDGVYVYANPEKISYDLNLQKTDCGDNAMD